jgi:hypothetical protein
VARIPGPHGTGPITHAVQPSPAIVAVVTLLVTRLHAVAAHRQPARVARIGREGIGVIALLDTLPHDAVATDRRAALTRTRIRLDGIAVVALFERIRNAVPAGRRFTVREPRQRLPEVLRLRGDAVGKRIAAPDVGPRERTAGAVDLRPTCLDGPAASIVRSGVQTAVALPVETVLHARELEHAGRSAAGLVMARRQRRAT